jgi:hypothetical protein
MFAFAFVLILFVLVDFLLESFENLFSPEELTEMGICLDGSLAVETR